jgi:hypothetical protein
MYFRLSPRQLFLNLLLLILCCGSSWGQPGESYMATPEGLQKEIDQLQAQVQQMKSELDELRRGNAAKTQEGTGSDAVSPSQIDGHGERHETAQPDSSSVDSLREELGLVNQKVDEEYQTKVESASRYHVRLTGMFLVNFFGNRGVTDNIENPALPIISALGESNGSFGGTIRQTQLGLEVQGPDLFGARASGGIQIDFAGGFADSPGGFTVGLPRLRTGTVRLDWKNTSLVAGQDGLFFSPLSPTSFASIEQPPLAYSGNLWGWAPQVRIEHRFSAVAGSEITVEAGILDPISGESPADGNSRELGVGEASLQPALASHVNWTKSVFGKPLSIGAGAFRARQHWQPSGAGTRVTSWLVSSDWDIPTSRWTSVSGSFYRGKSIGVFGGGIGQSAIVSDTPGTVAGSEPLFSGLDSIGGWAQLKVQPIRKVEFNTAFGQDNPFVTELRSAVAISYAGSSLLRNRTLFSNVIYRPRSDLLFSLELRHIRGVQQVDESSQSANHINLGMGIFF